MADLRFENKNNQKKTLSVFSTKTDENGELFTLPEASYVVSITDINLSDGADGDGSISGITAGTYYPTGATVSISGVTEKELVIVEYIETELANGQYTD